MAGGTQYLFAVGRVKAKEEEIIDAGMWQRLIDAESDEALRLLKDHGYGESGEDFTGAGLYRSVFVSDRRKQFKIDVKRHCHAKGRDAPFA